VELYNHFQEVDYYHHGQVNHKYNFVDLISEAHDKMWDVFKMGETNLNLRSCTAPNFLEHYIWQSSCGGEQSLGNRIPLNTFYLIFQNFARLLRSPDTILIYLP